jgi:hypothetical protein
MYQNLPMFPLACFDLNLFIYNLSIFVVGRSLGVDSPRTARGRFKNTSNGEEIK